MKMNYLLIMNHEYYQPDMIKSFGLNTPIHSFGVEDNTTVISLTKFLFTQEESDRDKGIIFVNNRKRFIKRLQKERAKYDSSLMLQLFFEDDYCKFKVDKLNFFFIKLNGNNLIERIHGFAKAGNSLL